MVTTIVIVLAWAAFVTGFLIVWRRVLRATGRPASWELDAAGSE